MCCIRRQFSCYLIANRKFTEAKNNGLLRRSFSKNPIGLLNQDNFLKSRFNSIRKCSTDKCLNQTQFTSFQKFLINFVNQDTLLTVVFSVFLYYDYKKYKEEDYPLMDFRENLKLFDHLLLVHRSYSALNTVLFPLSSDVEIHASDNQEFQTNLPHIVSKTKV